MTTGHRIKYVGPAGEIIYLDVPWPERIGLIPPPVIEIQPEWGGEPYRYEYRGSE